MYVNQTKENIVVANNFIVPYNPWITLKYKGHVNVEIVTSTSSVKYLHKYIHKGSDRIMVQVAGKSTQDEITRFIDGRYLGGTEAFWRHYEYSLRHQYPPVKKLALHLENEQIVVFDENCDLREAAKKKNETTLMFPSINLFCKICSS